MSKRDYYQILGVNKTASQDEIKSAYRKLAIKHHPDKNRGDSNAEHKFKEINEAYDVLKDSQKRATYDQFGHGAFQGGGGAGRGGQDPFSRSAGFEGFNFSGGGGAFSDIFEDLFSDFGSGRRRGRTAQSQVRGADLRYNMQISLEEAFKGKTDTIKFTASVACDGCAGTGSEDQKKSTCSTCNGSGKIRMQQGFFAIEKTCHTCNGEGEIIKNPCKKCNGSGKIRKEKSLSVNIPAGVEDGTRIRLAGEGEAGHRGGPSGDLYIFMSVTPHEIFTRETNDLHCKVPIKMTTAALGGDLEVPSVDGTKVKLTIPEGTQSEDTFRLKSKGMTKLRSTARGDMYVHIHVETPVKLSKKQRKLLEDFETENEEVSSPESASFFKQVKDLFG